MPGDDLTEDMQKVVREVYQLLPRDEDEKVNVLGLPPRHCGRTIPQLAQIPEVSSLTFVRRIVGATELVTNALHDAQRTSMLVNFGELIAKHHHWRERYWQRYDDWRDPDSRPSHTPDYKYVWRPNSAEPKALADDEYQVEITHVRRVPDGGGAGAMDKIIRILKRPAADGEAPAQKQVDRLRMDADGRLLDQDSIGEDGRLLLGTQVGERERKRREIGYKLVVNRRGELRMLRLEVPALAQVVECGKWDKFCASMAVPLSLHAFSLAANGEIVYHKNLAPLPEDERDCPACWTNPITHLLLPSNPECTMHAYCWDCISSRTSRRERRRATIANRLLPVCSRWTCCNAKRIARMNAPPR